MGGLSPGRGDGWRAWRFSGFDFAGSADPCFPDGNCGFTLNAAGIETTGGDPLSLDCTVGFHVLTGDANGDRVTNAADL